MDVTPSQAAAKRKGKPRAKFPYTTEQRLALAFSVMMSCTGADVPAPGAAKQWVAGCVKGDAQMQQRAREWLAFIGKHVMPTAAVSKAKADHLARDMRTHFTNLLNTGSVETVQAAERARKHDIPEGVLRSCVVALTENEYLTAQDALVNNAIISSTCATWGCSMPYLLKRLHEIEPRLAKIAVEIKQELSDDTKKKRLDYANNMLTLMSSGLVDNVVFLDQKNVYLAPKACKRWGLKRKRGRPPPPRSSNVKTHPLKSSKCSRYCIYYYSAVMGKLGPIGLYLTTGSKGPGVKPSQYTVSMSRALRM